MPFTEPSQENLQLTQAAADFFAELGHDLIHANSTDDVLAFVTARGASAVPGAEHASISRGRRGKFDTIAATSDVPPRIDTIQYELHSGPCVDAARFNKTFQTGDLANDQRWPAFGIRAAQAGIVSMLSMRLLLEDDDSIASLNLYSSRHDAFDASSESVATLIATHAATAITVVRVREKVVNLSAALDTKGDIGIAIGIVMGQYRVSKDQAFDLMKMASQHTHHKITEVARQITETGMIELPQLPPRNAA
jgi:GAF domain-containing protein